MKFLNFDYFETHKFFGWIEDWIHGWFEKTMHTTLQTISDVSFNACLLVGLIAFILYIFGWEKGKKIAIISPVIYILIKIVGELVFGV